MNEEYERQLKEALEECRAFLAENETKIIDDIFHRLEELCPEGEHVSFSVAFTVLCGVLSRLIFCHITENSYDQSIEGVTKYLKFHLPRLYEQEKEFQERKDD